MTCPRCDAELWALAGSGSPTFYIRHPGQSLASFLAALAGPSDGLSAREMEEVLKQADSLDLVELVMEIEDRLRGQTGALRLSP
jgi:hypothetical protein